jgi:purine-binding chemotaxis protein CheW
VDSASEVLKIPASDVETSPTALQQGGTNCVTGLGKYRGRLIVLLDMNKLLDFDAAQRRGEKVLAQATVDVARGATASK